MKKSNQTIPLLIILFAGFVISGCQKSFDPNIGFRTIVLQVNTADIHPGADVEKYASFPGQAPGVSLVEFTTNVGLGDTILWIGVSSSNPFEDEVIIEQINYQGGDNLLGHEVINGIDCKVLGIIQAKGKDQEKGKEEKYVLHFKVIKQGDALNPEYKIDPKLRILE